jgi:uncharacterized protein
VKPGNDKSAIVRSLFADFTEPIRDPLWKHIYLSAQFRKLTETPSFQKLSHIKQLGPAHLVYPGATHTRFAHSLGVFQIAKRLITELVRRDESHFFSLSGVNAFLCAALLHDIGHYPYAHSLKDLDVENHEKLTAQKILESELADIIKTNFSIDPADVAAIVDHDMVADNRDDIVFFRNCLSGVLDPDKLDYLNRDALFCGIPYGTQDVDFILSDVLPHPSRGIAVTERGLMSVESILFSKYLMYKTVYWHKTVRIATAMIKKAIRLALIEEKIKKSDLYSLDDYGLFQIARSIPFAPFALIEGVLQRNLHKQVYKVLFVETDPRHVRIESLDSRLELEDTIGSLLAKKAGIQAVREQIIIDVPERISFEMDVPVIDTGNKAISAYPESGSVFNKQTVSQFSKSIRTISVFIARKPELLGAAQTFDFSEFF